MAGNSSTYFNQVNLLNADLSYWIDYIETNAAVISQFNDTIDNLQDQINNLNTNISALSTKLNLLQTRVEASIGALTPYVKVSNNQFSVTYGLPEMWEAHLLSQHENFIESYTNLNEVYVYSTKTIKGLTIDGHNVVSAYGKQDSSHFYKFYGSEKGIRHHILFTSLANIPGAYLIFSSDSTFRDVDADNSVRVNVLMQPKQVEKNTIVTPASLRDSITNQAISNMVANTNTTLNVQRASANVKSK